MKKLESMWCGEGEGGGERGRERQREMGGIAYIVYMYVLSFSRVLPTKQPEKVQYRDRAPTQYMCTLHTYT